MSQRAVASSLLHIKSPKAEPFSEQDALGGTCFCPLLAPSGRRAKTRQPSIKGAECRIPPLCIFASFRSNPTCWCGLSCIKAACLVKAAHAGKLKKKLNKKTPLSSSPPSSPFSPSNPEIICKEIIGLARANLLHINFVRLTSRGQCSVWPLVGSTRIYFIRLKRQS